MHRLKTLLLFIFTSILLTSYSQAADFPDRDKDALFLMLSQTQELNIHQMRGATKNKVFVHKDGHKEAVFDENGSLVQDGINDGSYNYAHPQNDPFGHYTQDIHPWINFGMSRKDPTSKQERIQAYILDLEQGIVRARELWSKTPNSPSRHSNQKLPEAWTKILDKPEIRKCLKLVRGEIELTDDNLISSLELIHDAFNEVY